LEFHADVRSPSPGLSDDLSEIVSSSQGDVARTEVSQRTGRSKISANVSHSEADWPLFIGWLTAALRPVGPHPILAITGEQGAAKTTMLRVCRRLIDRNASPVRAHPKELRNLMIAARKSWLKAYDNITTLPAWLSDGLFVRAYTDEQNRSVHPVESIPKTGMTGTSKQGPRRSHGAGRRSHGAETHFEPSMQAI
jgi:hypothetical protein